MENHHNSNLAGDSPVSGSVHRLSIHYCISERWPPSHSNCMVAVLHIAQHLDSSEPHYPPVECLEPSIPKQSVQWLAAASVLNFEGGTFGKSQSTWAALDLRIFLGCIPYFTEKRPQLIAWPWQPLAFSICACQAFNKASKWPLPLPRKLLMTSWRHGKPQSSWHQDSMEQRTLAGTPGISRENHGKSMIFDGKIHENPWFPAFPVSIFP